VCLELVNIFDMFIPQLLRYPNPSDPLNGEAASLLMKDAESYNRKVKGAQNIPDLLAALGRDNFSWLCCRRVRA
jgi:hypothetical protein